jgi:predicted nucleic acid-binding protein
MATVLDTSALVVLMRRSRPPDLEPVADAARGELEAGRALLSAVTLAELLVGSRGEAAMGSVTELLDRLPVVDAGREVARLAGRMGAAARQAGATIPLTDLLIGATAVWLDLPLLTCDSDFRCGIEAGGDSSLGLGTWSKLRLHHASP